MSPRVRAFASRCVLFDCAGAHLCNHLSTLLLSSDAQPEGPRELATKYQETIRMFQQAVTPFGVSIGAMLGAKPLDRVFFLRKQKVDLGGNGVW